MYPRTSPQYLRPSADGVVTSPRKKLNVKSVRETFALPAIHQFTPVLTTAASRPALSPHSGLNADADATLETSLSPSQRKGVWSKSPSLAGSSNPRSVDKNKSPRLRPQPPPPVAVAAVASRTDQDLYRYSQGTRQRMAIRPLFEQRREEEAEVARRILTSREVEAPGSHANNGLQLYSSENEQEEGDGSVSNRQSRSSSSRRATTPIAAGEIADLRSTTHSLKSGHSSSRSIRTPRSERGESGSGPVTERGETRLENHDGDSDEDENDGMELVNVRFNTPTPPSSAGPSRSHITTSSARATPEGHNEEPSSDTFGPHTPEQSGVPSDPKDSSSRSSGGEIASQSTFHEPFLQKRASKVNWLMRTPSVSSPLSTQDQASLLKTSTQRTPPPPATVCYKLLWKGSRTARNDDGTLGQHEMRVLLGSNGKAHVSIQMTSAPADQDDAKIDVTNADLLASTKMRPDLPVMTPKWAKWLLSRMERDTHGVWFLRVQDLIMMEDCCVFEEDVVITLGSPSEISGQLVTPEQPHTVGVVIYLLGGDENDDGAASLLVHARDRSSTSYPPPLTEVILKNHELETIAKALGFVAASPDSVEPSSDGHPKPNNALMRKLVRDKDFLRRAVAESKALRLALKSGLHITESTNTIDDLPFRSGSRAATAMRSASSGLDGGLASDDGKMTVGGVNGVSRTIAEYEAQGLSYANPETQQLIHGNEWIAETAFLAQAYCEDAVFAALRWFERRQAVEAYAASYVRGDDDSSTLSEGVRKRIEAAKQAKLEDIATRSIIEDMIYDFIATECRMELHHAKHSGGYDDYYASKVQATFRMSYHRRDYITKRHVRLRAAQLIQALQRGILARRKYCEMRVEREKYMFYGFRSSLHTTKTTLENPRQRAMDLARETERRRQTFLMQVLHGYVAEHGLALPFRVSPELVQTLFNEYSVVVGCAATLGDSVAAVLISSRHPQSPKKAEAKVPPPRLFGSKEIHAALVTALRMQYDETYGLSSNIRQIDARERSPTKAQLMIGNTSKARQSAVSPVVAPSNENTPPRWLLKTSVAFQRANRNRLAALRLTQRATGQRAAHLVALDYRNLLHESFHELDKCRAIWEDSIRSRKQQTLEFDGFSVDGLVQYALDRLMLAVKDWGLDPEPLFEALNLCLLHRLGKQAIALTEQAFNRFALGVNEMHGKRDIYPLRDEISQELEEFEQLLALRCLNIAADSVETVPPSEILHIVLTGSIDDEYVRHALPSILPIASVAEKAKLADKVVRGYANALYGDAFNSVCWSCLDTAESVTVEAAQFLERITRRPVEGDDSDGEVSITTRALYLLTGSQALRFLQFLAKVAHFNKPLQRRVLEQLAPFAEDAELYRLASVVCSIDSFEVVTRLFDECFDAKVLHSATRFWVQYGTLYGEERAEAARATCLQGRTADDETTGTEEEVAATAPPEETDTTPEATGGLNETTMTAIQDPITA